jgi:predicted nuclease of restriction endonuclease-like (RecB) superfamily
MAKKVRRKIGSSSAPIYERIRDILESARTNVARSVNTTQVVANWLIGREIVEEEQSGDVRADYGESLLVGLSSFLEENFGRGYSVDSLERFRGFYVSYPNLLGAENSAAVRRNFSTMTTDEGLLRGVPKKSAAVRRISGAVSPEVIRSVANSPTWKPGQLHSNLSWTHYRMLLRVDQADARAFYEIEALKNNWSARELERQISSLLFERLAKSKNKRGLMRLATRGHEISTPADIFKDPVVIEFLGLPESHKLVESDLETALLDNLQAFLLELGKGFAFVARQERITLDGDHFNIDLVFYHVVLKCFVLIDLKVGKLTHADLGQLQLYVNYFNNERCSTGDNPTLGLILCTDKNDTVVQYTLGPEQSRQIFASRYELYLPTEDELREEIHREVRRIPTVPDTLPAKKNRKR